MAGLLNSMAGVNFGDDSALSGIGSGLSSFAQAFRQTRMDQASLAQQALENQQKQKMYNLDLAKSGYEENPTPDDGNGIFRMSKSYIEKQKSDKLAAAQAEKAKEVNETRRQGFLKFGANINVDADGNIVGQTPVPGLSNPEMQMKALELKKAQKEAADPFNQAGKLQQGEATRLMSANTKSDQDIDELKAAKAEYDTASPGQKYQIGQEILQKLVIGGKVPRALVSKIGGYLDRFHPDPDAPLGFSAGRDFNAFGTQVDNAISRIDAGKGETQKKIAGLIPGYTPQGLIPPSPPPPAAPAPTAAAEHPQDQQAVMWAKSNPQDPRSKAILQANGM